MWQKGWRDILLHMCCYIAPPADFYRRTRHFVEQLKSLSTLLQSKNKSKAKSKSKSKVSKVLAAWKELSWFESSFFNLLESAFISTTSTLWQALLWHKHCFLCFFIHSRKLFYLRLKLKRRRLPLTCFRLSSAQMLWPQKRKARVSSPGKSHSYLSGIYFIEDEIAWSPDASCSSQIGGVVCPLGHRGHIAEGGGAAPCVVNLFF